MTKVAAALPAPLASRLRLLLAPAARADTTFGANPAGEKQTVTRRVTIKPAKRKR